MCALLFIDKQFIDKLYRIIESNYSDDSFGVTQLYKAMGVSRATLHRKLKKTIDKTTGQVIYEVRLKKAKELLQKGVGTVAEVAFEVGFTSPSYFNRCFHRFYGYSPGKLIKINDTYFKPAQGKKNNVSKKNTIVILPFINDGPEFTNNYIIQGLREEIINKLQFINDMYVVSRTTADTYSGSNKTAKEIANELNVNYVIEGSGQSIQNKVRIRIQLIEAATDLHLWSQPYECNLSDNNLFEIQEDVALQVANELQAKITPEEDKRIRETPAKNLAAFLHFQNGVAYSMLAKNEKYSRFWKDAESEFNQALRIDSDYGNAWLKLAEVNCFYKLWPVKYMSGFLHLPTFKKMLNEATQMYKKAVNCGVSDKNLQLFITSVYNQKLIVDHSGEDVEKDYIYFRIMGYIAYFTGDYVSSIKYWLKYRDLIKNSGIAAVDDLHYLISLIGTSGFSEVAKYLARETLQQTNDSVRYNYSLIPAEAGSGNIDGLYNLLSEFHKEDPTDSVYVNFLMNLSFLKRDYKEAFLFLQKRNKLFHKNDIAVEPNIYMAGIYHIRGMEEEKMWHCNLILENDIALLSETIVPMPAFIYIDLAAIYALVGQTDKALLCLKKIAKLNSITIEIIFNMSALPHFDHMRNIPEFNSLLKQIFEIYQKGKMRIQKLLIEKRLMPSI